jgi:hypothetical protein
MVGRFFKLCPSFLRHVIFCFVVPVFSYISKNLPQYTRIDFLLFCPAVSLNYETLNSVNLILSFVKESWYLFLFSIFFVFLRFVSVLSCSVYDFFPEYFVVCILIRVVTKHSI